MEKLNPLHSFIQLANIDNRLLPSHISLFLALYWLWQKVSFQSPFYVFRKDVMPYAKISSIVTYHKCIKELSNFGYIIYQPSYNCYQGSEIIFQNPKVH